MPIFSANLSFLFQEHDFLDRFAASKEAGFKYIECCFPYDYSPEVLHGHLVRNGLKQVLINMPAGDLNAGELGLASDPDRMDEFRRGVRLALDYAKILEIDRINCLVGKRIEEKDLGEQRRVLLENVTFASSELAKENKVLLIEPINTFEVPGFFLSTSRECFELIHESAAANLMLQYDVYHMQKMEGNLAETIRENLHRIGHIQISDNPGRHQPGTGEINYSFLLRELDKINYRGFVGLEYYPTSDTPSSLAWIREWGFEDRI